MVVPGAPTQEMVAVGRITYSDRYDVATPAQLVTMIYTSMVDAAAPTPHKDAERFEPESMASPSGAYPYVPKGAGEKP